jgi:hypothetical protein
MLASASLNEDFCPFAEANFPSFRGSVVDSNRAEARLEETAGHAEPRFDCRGK